MVGNRTTELIEVVGAGLDGNEEGMVDEKAEDDALAIVAQHAT